MLNKPFTSVDPIVVEDIQRIVQKLKERVSVFSLPTIIL